MDEILLRFTNADIINNNEVNNDTEIHKLLDNYEISYDKILVKYVTLIGLADDENYDGIIIDFYFCSLEEILY